MGRLIDADLLLEVSNYEFYQDASAITPIGEHILFKFKNLIRNFPSAQPKIIRCKDCKHFTRDIPCVGGHYDGCDEWTDNGNEIMVAEDDFCSYAERREE